MQAPLSVPREPHRRGARPSDPLGRQSKAPSATGRTETRRRRAGPPGRGVGPGEAVPATRFPPNGGPMATAVGSSRVAAERAVAPGRRRRGPRADRRAAFPGAPDETTPCPRRHRAVLEMGAAARSSRAVAKAPSPAGRPRTGDRCTRAPPGGSADRLGAAGREARPRNRRPRWAAFRGRGPPRPRSPPAGRERGEIAAPARTKRAVGRPGGRSTNRADPPAQARPAAEESEAGSTPRRAKARCHLLSSSPPKTSSSSAGATSQPLAWISASSWPGAQPA